MGSVLEGPTGSCSVIPGVWAQQLEKLGLPPGYGGAAGLQCSRGLLVPRMRWGGHGWTDAPGLERGAGWKCHWNHHREEGERPGGGRWVIAPMCR